MCYLPCDDDTSWFGQTNLGRATVARVMGQSLGPCCDPYQTQLQGDGKMHTSISLHLPKRDDRTFTHPFSLKGLQSFYQGINFRPYYKGRGRILSCIFDAYCCLKKLRLDLHRRNLRRAWRINHRAQCEDIASKHVTLLRAWNQLSLPALGR